MKFSDVIRRFTDAFAEMDEIAEAAEYEECEEREEYENFDDEFDAEYATLSDMFRNRPQANAEGFDDFDEYDDDGDFRWVCLDDFDWSALIPFGYIFTGLRDASVEAAEQLAAEPRPRLRLLPTFAAMAVCLLVLGGVAYYILCAHNLRAVLSVEQLEVSANAYTMTHSGDYGFGEFLEEGGASSDEELAEFLSRHFSGGLLEMPCPRSDSDPGADSVLTAENARRLSGTLVGRSYSCKGELMSMVVITRPGNGLGMNTVSTANLNWLGYTPYDAPGKLNGYAALAAIYLPLDGMNSYGLVVSALEASEDVPLVVDTDRPDLTFTTAIRLLLDRAQDVEDAVYLLERYDLFPSCGRMYHIAVSDQNGAAVVIQWSEGKMIVTESPCASNGYSSAYTEEIQTDGNAAALRVRSLSATHSRYAGSMTRSQVITAMERASTSGDGWLSVYDTWQKTAVFVFDGDSEKQFSVAIY